MCLAIVTDLDGPDCFADCFGRRAVWRQPTATMRFLYHCDRETDMNVHPAYLDSSLASRPEESQCTGKLTHAARRGPKIHAVVIEVL